MGNSNLDNLRLNRHDKRPDLKPTSVNLVGPQPKDGEKGIYIQGREGRLFLSMSTLSKGILALGEPGAGKTVLIGQIVDRIINQMTDEDVIIIFDAKGDYQKMFYNCADPRSILISSRESDAENAKGWNIFGEFLDHNGNFGENTEFLAEQMSEMLFAPIKDEKQPFFHEAAMAIFTKVLMGFVENAKKTGDYSLLNNEALKP